MLYRLRTLLMLFPLAFACFLGIVLGLLSPFNTRLMTFISGILGRATLFVFNIKMEIRGREHFEKANPCIIVSNHQNNLDIVLGGLFAPPRTVSLGKKEILRIPFYGLFYWLSGNILIDRAQKLKAVDILNDKVIKTLQKGTCVWILPEGTRSYNKGLLPFKRGAFRTVIHAQVPLVPIVLSPFHSTLDFNKWNSGKIIIEILPPIETKNLTLEDDRALTKNTWELFSNKIAELEKELKAP